MKNVLYLDTETFSKLDIKKVGAVKYAESAEVMLCGFKLNDQYDYYDFDSRREVPDWAVKHILNGGIVAAHNALFDYCVCKKGLLPFLKIEQMVDTQAIVAAHGLPLSLEKAGAALGVEKAKYGGGSRLITKFCKPRKPTKHNKSTRNMPDDFPSDWIEFRDTYLKYDILAMEEIHDKLGTLTDKEQQYWIDTQKINLQGIPIDLETTEYILGGLDKLVNEESTEFIRITGLFPTQRDRVLEWVKAQGVKCPNLQAATVEEILANPKCPDHVRAALTHRANCSHMSFKKFEVIKTAAMEDQTVKGTLMYHVGHTGRFGGRLLQPQNLTKGKIDGEEAVHRIHAGEFTVDLIKSAVRPMIWHPDGFTISDFKSIEARTVQWFAKDYKALKVFEDGQDPYIWMAAKIYDAPYDEITDDQRFCGKQCILGLGFQMSAPKFVEMMASYGVEMPLLEAQKAVRIYRQTHKKVVQLWDDIQAACVMAIRQPADVIGLNQRIRIYMEGDFLRIQLPSKRCLSYYKPQLEESFNKLSFSYMGVNEKSQYVRVRTYGGKLTENVVQGMARDLLVHGVNNLMRRYRVVTHIHDEVVVLGQHPVEKINEIICDTPFWAKGLPVEADGFTSTRFKKG